jgi:hypothetical protein
MRTRLVLALALAAATRARAAGSCAELEGRYVAGDGYVGTVLELDADCAADLAMSSDAGDGWKARATGTVDGGVLSLSSETVRGRAPASYVSVPWGRRLYLVPESGLDAFCNAFNAGAEPSHLPWMLRRGAWKPSEPRPTAPPLVPASHRARVLARPISARVLSVDRKEKRETVNVGGCEERKTVETELVTVGVGAGAGLLAGHVLYASNPRRPSLRARLAVRSVETDRASAEVLDQGIAKVRAGDAVSTRAPDSSPEG